jgi:hypothetical protein
MISSGVVFMMATLFGVSFAWFTSMNSAALNNGQGYTASAYFAGGQWQCGNPLCHHRSDPPLQPSLASISRLFQQDRFEQQSPAKALYFIQRPRYGRLGSPTDRHHR